MHLQESDAFGVRIFYNFFTRNRLGFLFSKREKYGLIAHPHLVFFLRTGIDLVLF